MPPPKGSKRQLINGKWVFVVPGSEGQEPTVRTASGQELSEGDVQAMADRMEAGVDPERLRPRRARTRAIGVGELDEFEQLKEKVNVLWMEHENERLADEAARRELVKRVTFKCDNCGQNSIHQPNLLAKEGLTVQCPNCPTLTPMWPVD